MQQSKQVAISAIRELGSVEQLRELAKKGYGPTKRPKVNVHIHLPPNFSAFESVKQAVNLAEQEGVGVLGVSNYYDFSVYGEFVKRARQANIFPLFGLEIIALVDELATKGIRINDPGNPGKMYICGKGINRFEQLTKRAAELIKTIRQNDDKRMAEMIGRIEAIFASTGLATHLDAKAIIDGVVRRHGCDSKTVTLQERHIAQAFQELLFKKVKPQQRGEFLAKLFGAASKADPEEAVAVQGEIRSQLMKANKPAFVAEAFVNFKEACELILELGGIPCYPTLADGTEPICEYENPVEKLIEELKANNIYMAELIPIRNQPSVLKDYVTAIRRAGIAVVGGTEHNTRDVLAIEPKCVGEQEVPEEIKEIFWEGACVVAAHQFLSTQGHLGYVGQQNISEFAKLGAAVIRKYEETERTHHEGHEDHEGENKETKIRIFRR
ncbi:MAG: hypothetical protein GWP14_09355 [Actinobacteria bacterium]|nr:hypothetical protein [Actinomycetota bacterium]